MLNQLDFVRRDVVRNLATKGQRATGLKGMARLIATLGVATFSKDLIVDLIRGKRISPDQIDDRAMNAVLGFVGLSTFLVKEAGTKPSAFLMDFLGPPTPVMDDLAHDIGVPFREKEFDGLATIRTLPLLGDLLYYWTPIGRGFYLNESDAKNEYNARLKELKAAADEAQQEGDHDVARTLMAIYNERAKAGPDRPATSVVAGHRSRASLKLLNSLVAVPSA
jgi:hypothetical protein